jgi:undecaprenyl-diphosphatase
MPFEQFDMPILKALNGFVGLSNTFDFFVYTIAEYDIFKGVPMLALVWFAWFLGKQDEPLRQQDDRRSHLLLVFAGSLFAVFLSRILQLTLNVHQRPVQAGLGLKFPAIVAPAAFNSWNSFPSDHSMMFFALATGLWRINRALGGLAFLWAAIVVDLPRIYLGIHFPSDVVVGAVLGALWMLGFQRLSLLKAGSDRLVAWGKRHEAPFYAAAFIATEQVATLCDDLRHIAMSLCKHFSLH